MYHYTHTKHRMNPIPIPKKFDTIPGNHLLNPIHSTINTPSPPPSHRIAFPLPRVAANYTHVYSHCAYYSLTYPLPPHRIMI